ncbi:hypothetical protein KTR9_4975 (plasmid) [Gordonia sp. KTR9]|nr:hypothetical protein KTR9_4975 [Gordonia sp. KTR9]
MKPRTSSPRSSTAPRARTTSSRSPSTANLPRCSCRLTISNRCTKRSTGSHVPAPATPLRPPTPSTPTSRPFRSRSCAPNTVCRPSERHAHGLGRPVPSRGRIPRTPRPATTSVSDRARRHRVHLRTTRRQPSPTQQTAARRPRRPPQRTPRRLPHPAAHRRPQPHHRHRQDRPPRPRLPHLTGCPATHSDNHEEHCERLRPHT